MIPPAPHYCRSWDEWCDKFEARNGRTHFIDELVAAAMACALDMPEPEPLTDEEKAIVSARNSKSPICGFPTAPGEFCELPVGHVGACGRGSRVPA